MAARKSEAEAFGHMATQAPQPMQAAASMARSAASLGTRMALPSGALPVDDGNEAAGGDHAVERAAVHHQVLDHRERARAPRLQVQLVAVLEVAHVKLAERGAGLRPVRDAVDHAAAHAADALAAIVVERHRLFALGDEVLVEHVEHFEERHVLVDVGHLVAHHAALIVRVLLPPDVEDDSHYL